MASGTWVWKVGRQGAGRGEQRVSSLAGVPAAIRKAQVMLQEGHEATLWSQLPFRETTRGGMKVAAAKGLETELDTRFLSSFGGPTCHCYSPPPPPRLGPRAGQRGVRSLDVLA